MYNPQLETFIKVVDRGSFSKAAEDLFISPSAVIKQINILETNLGLKLLKRTHQGVSLTPAGASLYRDVKYLIKYAKDSIVRAHKAMEKEEMVIRLEHQIQHQVNFLSIYGRGFMNYVLI